MNRKCTRVTLAGRPCRSGRVLWSASEVAPDPESCLSHLTAIERATHKKLVERWQAESNESWAPAVAMVLGDPACWSWPAPDHPGLADFQVGRCAICGHDADLVTDHDHATGLIRGYLCRSCNTCEGTRRGGVWDKYRDRNPASICGIREAYWDPFEKRFATPAEPPGDRWLDNPMRNIGL